MAYGMKGHFGLAKETIWGSGVAATDFVEIMDESIVTEIERFTTRNIVGRLSEPDDMAGLKRVTGDINMAAFPESMGFFLKSALGVSSMATEILSGFLYETHFTLNTSDTSTLAPVPSYTYEVARDVSSAQRITGAVVSNLTLACAANQDLRLTASIIGKTSAQAAISTPTYPGSPVNPFSWETCSFNLGGSASARMEAFSVSIDNQLEGIATLNHTQSIQKIRRTGPQIVRISGTTSFDDMVEYENFINQNEQSVGIHFFRADSFFCTIQLPRMVYTTFPLGMSGSDRITVEFEGKGLYHAGSLQSIRIALTTINSFW